MKIKLLIVGFLLPLSLGTNAFAQSLVVRVGAFPNITHPQAMIGKANGWFEKAMGPNVKIDWKSFNAGPSAIEAMFAGAIDMTYIGPNPTISGYVRSQGEALKVFHVRDGHGIKLLMSAGVAVAAVSGRRSAAVAVRMRELGVRPASVSKYCVAVAALHPELPSNPWHQTLRRYFGPCTVAA